jgi:hypothetical protein
MKRSRIAPGSIVDRANIVPLCRLCHDFITCNPLLAEREGLALRASDPWHSERLLKTCH